MKMTTERYNDVDTMFYVDDSDLWLIEPDTMFYEPQIAPDVDTMFYEPQIAPDVDTMFYVDDGEQEIEEDGS